MCVVARGVVGCVEGGGEVEVRAGWVVAVEVAVRIYGRSGGGLRRVQAGFWLVLWWLRAVR